MDQYCGWDERVVWHVADPWCYFVGREYAHHYFSKAASSNGCTSGSWHHYLFALEDELLYFPSCNITQTDQTIISYDYGKVWGWFSLPIPIERLEADDGLVFLLGEVPSLDIRIQIVILPPYNSCHSRSALSALRYLDRDFCIDIQRPSGLLLWWSIAVSAPLALPSWISLQKWKKLTQ